ncbi:nucleotidyl transferase AbiEii/AbiGii toxin family protein [Micrococcus luteus]|nr:nucleotidyl transferase AbiEii/AbiGii toxin family protein [Micrococcus luteus]
MITREEIIEKGKEFDINTSNVQRDYVFGWFLAGIYHISELKDHLVLKGGNALRKAYFENTRFSGDLDFAVQHSLAQELIQQEMDKICDFVQTNAGVIFEKEKNKVSEKQRIDKDKKVYEVKIFFKDFYAVTSQLIISIKMDITQFDKVHLPIQKRYLVHPYSDFRDIPIEISCLKLEEILASKLKCLLQRRHSSDLYDYVFSFVLNNSIELNRMEIIKTFSKMTIFEESSIGVARSLLVDLPFQFIKGFWEKHLVVPQRGKLHFETATEKYKQIIDEMFGSLPIGRGELAFFPSHFRNTILEAGQKMMMLQVNYNGTVRLVEPYSLVYKVTKQGIGSEYLYVFDTTSRPDSAPSVKSFMHTKIDSIELTDIKFQPRFEVEISKAGEYQDNTYFGRSRTTKPKLKRTLGKQILVRNRSSRAKVASGPTFIYKCSYCNKEFRRKTHNGSLNSHKDKYGNKCYGKRGFFIRTVY